MTDQRFTELLGKQLTGEISPEESNELELLLSSDESYRQEYKSLNAYFDEKEGPDEHIDEVFNRIKSRIAIPEQVDEEVIIKPTQSKHHFKIWFQIAAVLILFVSGVVLYKSYFNNDRINWQSINVPASEKKNLTLADGTTVTLNSASQLKYPANFKGDTREVYLAGEAYFDVKKDAERPFIIHTDKIQVKVLGTAFDVKAYPNDDFTETTLIRGRVEIRLKDNTATPFILNPGEKFVLTNHDHKASLSKLTYFFAGDVNSIIETSWTKHELMFKNNDFASISRLFERWYDVKIVFKNEALKSFKFTGKFKGESIIDALKALKMIEHFNFNVQGKIVYLYN
ncbi:FecR family protein [Pedobacter punctiformis]|uniref:FecR family protein n=1 Tax=Pedobacter punctiformis TaxID=3004097 RepID=A0ABT4LBZ9_9SPHI|nr:FecR family protein [Pedobacter sp. HCMS5-2]MCZ4245452.1 FecR family protein [Pedobacter sp. HCMS5-2]